MFLSFALLVMICVTLLPGCFLFILFNKQAAVVPCIFEKEIHTYIISTTMYEARKYYCKNEIENLDVAMQITW